MPVFQPSRPLTPLHQKLNRYVVPILAFAGIGLGIWEARDCANIRYGYVATYAYASAVVLAISFSALGLLLAFYWRTRWFGLGLIAVGVLSCASFYTGMAILLKQDRVAWRHEPPPTPIGPNVEASAVIYFRHGVTDAQIEDFRTSVLMESAEPRHEGRDYPTIVYIYLRLLPSQANGYEAIAITFRHDAPAAVVNQYLGRIKGDSRIETVFLNTSPDSIRYAHH